jgi:two-component system, cell cycle sensor histidine kinase and response regulator CckA
MANLIGGTKEKVLAQNFYKLESWKKSGVLKIAKEVIEEKTNKRKSIEVTSSFGKKIAIDCHFAQFSFGEKQHLLVTTTDITQKVKSEKSILKQKRKAERYLNLAGVMFIGLDIDGNINLVNKKACNILECDRKDIIGLSWFENFISDSEQDEVYDVFRQLMNGKIEPVEYYENNILSMEGKTKSIAWHNTIIKNNNGGIIGILSSGEDITEKKQLMLELQQAQKMESVGRLAGGVAHDYNNALTAIMGYTELALIDADPKGPLHEDLNEVLKASRRAKDITRQLLAFARKQTIAPKVLDLNTNIESMLKMLRRLIGEDIDLVWLPGKSLWSVKMDPSQIDQILANLCVNARDAIEGVGKITIETATKVFDPDYCTDHTGSVPGEFVMLTISDNGCGMDKEILNNIFEPFFTTKTVDKGTGLGLSTVYGIVKQNNGFINVYSESGKGTGIKIYLPRHDGKAVDIQEEKKAKIPLGHGETILVVEDDIPILKLAQKILKGLKYNVLIADTPKRAMRLAKEYTDKIHILVTDVIMPEINGRELSEQLKILYPDLKCIFMSGYTANAIAHHGVLDEGVHFVQKPFSKKDMATIVRKVFDE